MKQIYQLPPCSIYDVPAMETWLTDLARSGLHLVKAGRRYWVFTRKHVSDPCLRMEPVIDRQTAPTDEVAEYYALSGWEFAACLQESFLIWRRTRPDAGELHSDPVIHSMAYEQLYRRLRKNAICAAILPFVLLALFACGLLLSPNPVTLLLANPSMLLLIPAEMLSGIHAVHQTLELRRLKQLLANGLPAVHEKDYRKDLLLRRGIHAAASLPFLMVLILPLIVFLQSWKKTVTDVRTAMPYLPLDVIEQEEGFSWHTDTYMRGNVNLFNSAARTWSPLVPVHYEIYQQGAVRQVQQHNGQPEIEPSARTEYFQLAVPDLAEPLYNEQLKRLRHCEPGTVITELCHPAFDHVTLAVSQGYSQLFAHRGGQVIYIRYFGPVDLSEKLDLLADAVLHCG